MKKKSFIKRSIEYRLWHNFTSAKGLRGLMAIMLRARYRPWYAPSPGVEPKNEIILLVHGLMHGACVMHNFAEFLSAKGYSVAVYDYRTTTMDYPEHAREYKEFLHSLLKEKDMPVNLITHSMGGIITRIALGEDDSIPRSRLKRIVMLAPPNRGSDFALELRKKIPRLSGFLCKPLRNLCSDPESLIHQLPWPQGVETGVIAGIYDKRVPLDSAPYPGQKDYLELSCGHSFMMYNREVFRQSVNFIEDGEFIH